VPHSIPKKAYTAFPGIMGFGGTVGITGIEDVAVPTQPLSSMLLDARVKRTSFFASLATGAGVPLDLNVSWNDVSDFNEVHVNGVLVAADSELPQPTDERIIVMASLEVAGTPSHYGSAQFVRTAPDATTTRVLVAEWGGVTTDLLCPAMTAPLLLPQTLALQENNATFRNRGSGTGALCYWTVYMLSAERGVMALYPGV